MSNYTRRSSYWQGKDSLSDSDPEKIISGDDFDDEFELIETAINTKADLNGDAGESFSAITAASGTNTTQVATTAFVQTEIATEHVDTTQLVDDSVNASKLDVTGNGTSGQLLTSDGDGSMSWADNDALDTSLSNVDSTGRQKIIKAWAVFNADPSVSVGDSYNVSSVTENGTGQYYVNLSVNMGSTNYSAIGNASGSAFENALSATCYVTSATQVALFTEYDNNGITQDYNNILIHGDA